MNMFIYIFIYIYKFPNENLVPICILYRYFNIPYYYLDRYYSVFIIVYIKLFEN